MEYKRFMCKVGYNQNKREKSHLVYTRSMLRSEGGAYTKRR